MFSPRITILTQCATWIGSISTPSVVVCYMRCFFHVINPKTISYSRFFLTWLPSLTYTFTGSGWITADTTPKCLILQHQAHSFFLTLSPRETADFSSDPWIKHSTKITFPHPVEWAGGWSHQSSLPLWHPARHPATPPLPSDSTESSCAQTSSAAMVIRRGTENRDPQ